MIPSFSKSKREVRYLRVVGFDYKVMFLGLAGYIDCKTGLVEIGSCMASKELFRPYTSRTGRGRY